MLSIKAALARSTLWLCARTCESDVKSMRRAASFYLVAFLTATWGQPELFPYGTDQGDEELSNCDDCNSGMVSLQHDVQMYGNNHSSYVVSCRVISWSMVCWKLPKEKCRSVACWFRVSRVLIMVVSTVSLLTVSMARLLIERPLCQVCSWWSKVEFCCAKLVEFRCAKFAYDGLNWNWIEDFENDMATNYAC